MRSRAARIRRAPWRSFDHNCWPARKPLARPYRGHRSCRHDRAARLPRRARRWHLVLLVQSPVCPLHSLCTCAPLHNSMFADPHFEAHPASSTDGPGNASSLSLQVSSLQYNNRTLFKLLVHYTIVVHY